MFKNVSTFHVEEKTKSIFYFSKCFFLNTVTYFKLRSTSVLMDLNPVLTMASNCHLGYIVGESLDFCCVCSHIHCMLL